MENLSGVLGSMPRRPIQLHSKANNGASIKMNIGLSDWNVPAESVSPMRGARNAGVSRTTRSFAKKVIEVEDCSNANQKKITKKQ